MKNINLKYLYEESFVDNHVKHFNLNVIKKEMQIVTNGAYLDDENNTALRKVNILISNWYGMKVIRKEGNIEQELLEIPKDFLTSIIEYHYSDHELRVIGLGYNCLIEWVFFKPKIVVYGEE